MRKGPATVNMFKVRDGLSSPWIQFAMPTIYATNETNKNAQNLSEFTKTTAIALELKILLNSPQPNWPLLLKILLMRDSYLSSVIFSNLINHLPSSDCYKAALEQPFVKHEVNAEKCARFLCSRECNSVAEWACVDQGEN